MEEVRWLEIPAIFISLSSILAYIHSGESVYFMAALVFSVVVAEYGFDKELRKIRGLLSYESPWDPLDIYAYYILISVSTLEFLLDGTAITFGIVFMLYCLFVKRMLRNEFSKIAKGVECLKRSE
jgi:hypothetical protein